MPKRFNLRRILIQRRDHPLQPTCFVRLCAVQDFPEQRWTPRQHPSTQENLLGRAVRSVPQRADHTQRARRDWAVAELEQGRREVLVGELLDARGSFGEALDLR